LDLCCGNGQLAAVLVERGLQVTGIDSSAELLRFARRRAPAAAFLLADARAFAVASGYDAALSLFDSLNHIMSLDELGQVFHNVYVALVSGGHFLFDLNMDDGYQARWRGSFGMVDENHACVIRSAYAAEERTARMDVTMFDKAAGHWQRSDVCLRQRCYADLDVQAALRGAGFKEIKSFDADRDLGMTGTVGRTFFLSQKP